MLLKICIYKAIKKTNTYLFKTSALFEHKNTPFPALKLMYGKNYSKLLFYYYYCFILQILSYSDCRIPSPLFLYNTDS